MPLLYHELTDIAQMQQDLRHIQDRLERKILATPTSALRESLTDANIHLSLSIVDLHRAAGQAEAPNAG